MDDRRLREYAENIYKGISGYTLNKAFSLFPKYYPKIAFYYTEILTKKQNETSMRMVQALGIDKGRALLNELNELNAKILKFYTDSKFKLDEFYIKLEASTHTYDVDIFNKEGVSVTNIINQTTDIIKESLVLFNEILAEAKKYNFKSLANDIKKAMKINTQRNKELFYQNAEFLKRAYQLYIQYQHKEQ